MDVVSQNGLAVELTFLHPLTKPDLCLCFQHVEDRLARGELHDCAEPASLLFIRMSVEGFRVVSGPEFTPASLLCSFSTQPYDAAMKYSLRRQIRGPHIWH
jgi:hypothetical protein